MGQQFYQKYKLGILGGGQLGRMLVQAGTDWNITFSVLDPDPHAPCSSCCEFQTGNLTDYDTVLAFGQSCDLITIEIENINVAALKELVKQGKKVFPQPEVIELVQNKRKQKSFYKDKNIPTSEFILVENKNDVIDHKSFLPAVHKLASEGYDGRGVQLLRTEGDLGKAFDAPGVLEKLIDFEKEIAVIVSRNEQGEVEVYPAVEMIFHPEANLVEYLFSPAQLTPEVASKARQIAIRIITELNMVGLLAVEMFVTRDHQVLVNEIAPRPHNSGHQSIEANVTSQYHQHLRAILNLPLGDACIRQPSAMVNLLGEENFSGEAKYNGLEEVLNISGVYVHLYEKKITKPFRKMGHVTIVDSDIESLKKKATFVKQTLKITA
jgi:5-(carboxyamino)imidazole ribonucleotide synthase